MKKTSLTALGGVITALSLAVMFIAGMIPGFTYIVPAFSGMFLIVTLEEEKKKRWTLFIYGAVSVLSMAIVPDKEISILYLLFFGYYPFIWSLLEGKRKVLSLLTKLIVFNAAMIITYTILIYIFLIPIEEMEAFGKWTPLLLLLMGNIVFLLYDKVIEGFFLLYRKKYHKRIGKLFGTGK